METDGTLKRGLDFLDLSTSSADHACPALSQGTKRPKTCNQLEQESIDALAELHVRLGRQSKEIASLRDTVDRQQQQIDMLLSIIGLSEPPVNYPGPSSSSSSAAAAAGAASTATELPFSVVVSRKQRKQLQKGPAPAIPLSAGLRTAVVSAVYRDFEDRDRRSKNIIVNGLPESGGNDDTSQVAHLIESEFGIAPKVVKCRRLGKPRPDKIQPLQVVLDDKHRAEYFVNQAKLLRQSSDDYVRGHVYINADVTQAEAHAAYLNRCDRRERATARARQPPTGPALPSPMMTAATSAAASPALTTQPSRQTTSTASTSPAAAAVAGQTA